MKRFCLATMFALVLPMLSVAHADDTISVDSLRSMTQTNLNYTYLNAKAGEMPDGESDGSAVFFADSPFNSLTQQLAALVWQGKVFDTDSGILVNKVFGFRAIKAEVFYGKSLMDGKESIIIDYGRTSILAHAIRDEIRQVGADLYLGRAYYRGLLGNYMVVNFILDFAQH